MRTLGRKSLTGGQVVTAWLNYHRWNRALADEVYSDEVAGKPVFLDLEDEVLSRAAITVGVETADAKSGLVDAVATMLNRPDHADGVFGRLLKQLRKWDRQTHNPPPVIGLLAVLCLAAEDMRQADGLGSNNYYDRLMPLLGVPSVHEKNQIVAAYRQVSRELWEALNGWLEDLQGERGLPTAYSFSHAHVGRPLSQALIRTADRKKLNEFFQAFGLAAHSRLSPYDMQALLNEWVQATSTSAPKGLCKLWKRAGARERITEVACSLLELWDGPTEVGLVSPAGPGRSRQLGLQVLLRSFPSREVEINVVGNGAANVLPEVTVEDVVAHSDSDSTLALEPVAGGRFRLADPTQVNTRSILEGHLRLRASSGALVERRPRRVVPLRKDHLLQAFVEVERLPLGEDALLFAQETRAQQVDDALASISRPGYKRLDPAPEGCPSGWVVFSDVQILSALPPLNPTTGKQWHLDLNVLQPIGTTQLTVEGGLQLPGRVRQWSSIIPPEVRVTSDSAAGLVLKLEQLREFGSGFSGHTWECGDPVAILPLDDLHLPDGDYLIEARAVTGDVSSQCHLIDQVRVRLRSGANPIPVPSEPPPPHLARSLEEMALGAIGAKWSRGSEEMMRGAILSRESAIDVQPGGFRFDPPYWLDRATSSVSSERSAARITVPAAETGDCFHTGAHLMDLPTFDGVASASSFEGVCRRCGLTKRYPSKFRMEWKAAKSKALKSAPMFDVSKVREVDIARDVDPDSVLDAMAFMNSGSGTALEQLALQVEPSRLFADRFLRGLEALGHVEVLRDLKTFYVIEWETTPPSFTQLTNESYAFVGRRSLYLTSHLKARAEKLGLQVHIEFQASGPSLVQLNGTDDAIEALAASAGQEVGVALQVVRQTAQVVASVLPPLSEVLQCLPRQVMTSFRSARRWNTETVRWETVGDASVPGAYQLFGAGTVYCLRNSDDIDDGTMQRGDARLVKHAEAHRQKAPIASYIKETGTLLTPLGADLPLLFGRPAVMATGLLPTEDTRRRLLAYANVPAEAAQQILIALTS